MSVAVNEIADDLVANGVQLETLGSPLLQFSSALPERTAGVVGPLGVAEGLGERGGVSRHRALSRGSIGVVSYLLIQPVFRSMSARTLHIDFPL